MMLTESSKGNQTDTGLPESFNQFGEDLKYKLAKMHEQFKVNFETTHANKLAKEIRDVYCQLSTTRKNQAIILSQTNCLLATLAIGLPVCKQNAVSNLSLHTPTEIIRLVWMDGPFIHTLHVFGNLIL